MNKNELLDQLKSNDLSKTEISEILNVLGVESLSNVDSIEMAKKIIDQIPLSYSWVKASLSNEYLEIPMYERLENEERTNLEISDINLAELFLRKGVFKFVISSVLLKSILSKNIISEDLNSVWMEKILESFSEDHEYDCVSVESSSRSSIFIKLISENLEKFGSLLNSEELLSKIEEIQDAKKRYQILTNIGMIEYLNFLQNTSQEISQFASLTYEKVEKHGLYIVQSEKEWKVICKSLDGDSHYVNLSLNHLLSNHESGQMINKLNKFDCLLPKFSSKEIPLIKIALSLSDDDDFFKLVERIISGHENDTDSGFLDQFFKEIFQFPKEKIEPIILQHKEFIESKELFNKGFLDYSHILDFSNYKKNLKIMHPAFIENKNQMDLFPDQALILKNKDLSDELFQYFVDKNSGFEKYVYIFEQSNERQSEVFDLFKTSPDLLLSLDLFSGVEIFRILESIVFAIKSRKNFKANSQQFTDAMDIFDFSILNEDDWTFFANNMKLSTKIQVLDSKVSEKLLKACPKKFHWIFQYRLSRSIEDFNPSDVTINHVVSTNAKDLFLSKNFEKFAPEVQNKIYNEINFNSSVLNSEESYSRFVFLVEKFSQNENDIEHMDKGILRYLKDKNIKIKNQTFSYLSCVSEDLLSYALSYVKETDKLSLLLDYNKDVSLETVNELLPYYKKTLLDYDREFFASESVILILSTIMPNEVFNFLMAIFDIKSFEILSKIKVSNKNLHKLVTTINSSRDVGSHMHSVIDLICNSLVDQLISIKEIVSLISNEKLSHMIEEKLEKSYYQSFLYEYIQELRSQNKEDLILSSTKYDLIKENTWDYFNIHFNSFKKLNNQEKMELFKNIEKSLEGEINIINCELIEEFKFSKEKHLLKVLKNSNKFYNVLETLINSENSDMTISVLNKNPDLIENISYRDSVTSMLCELYEKGFKTVFKYEFEGLKLSSTYLVDILNDYNDPFLLEKFKKNWKKFDHSNSDFSKEVVHELVKTIEKEDILDESLSYFNKKVYAQVAGIEIYKASLIKNKWVSSVNLRPDLEGFILSKFNKIVAEKPEKIYGGIMIDEPGTFIPQENIFDKHYFKIPDSVEEYLVYFKELGGEGFVPAIAVRNSNFEYIVEISLNDQSSLNFSDIEKQIRKKTYNISNQLDRIMKMDSSRTFGFELEVGVFGDDREDIAKYLRKKGFDINVAYSAKNTEGSQWDFKEDSSLDKSAVTYGDENEEEDSGDVFEIASPILVGEEGISEAKKFLDNLFIFEVISGQDVNAGLHVHHYVKDLLEISESTEEFLKTYLPFQETLYSLIKSYREDGEFCKKIKPEDIQEGRNVYGGHSGVILTSYGTMEFRMKEGMVSTEKIINWIKYTQQVVLAMEFKIKNDLKKLKSQNETMAQASAYLLIDFMRHGNNIKEKLKIAKKMVEFQEALYENRL